MEIAADIVGKVGFPVFVAMFLMLSYGNKLERILEEMKRTNVVLMALVRVIDDGKVSGVPQNIIDEVSGVVELPLQETASGKE